MGEDDVNLHQSLFWTQFWRFTAEAIRKMLISIEQEWDQVLRFILKKKKRKKAPKFKKAVQSDLSLKSEHQEEQSTYTSVTVREE